MTQSNNNIDERMLRKQEEDNLRAQDADLQQESQLFAVEVHKEAAATTIGTHNKKKLPPPVKTTQSSCPYSFIPLGMDGRTHKPSIGIKLLMEHEVTLQDLQKMTDLFYEKAFQDATLDIFIRSHSDPHGARFAKWIHQKLAGSQVWDEDRQKRGPHEPVHDRTSAHVAAWFSPKRPANERGRRFQLDECRVWMRLHFWALRESGLADKSSTFADYYVRFIGHFVAVYESTAQAFCRDSWRWSADPKNIETYIDNGRRMVDVLGLTLEESEAQIPESEATDFEWPYSTR